MLQQATMAAIQVSPTPRAPCTPKAARVPRAHQAVRAADLTGVLAAYPDRLRRLRAALKRPRLAVALAAAPVRRPVQVPPALATATPARRAAQHPAVTSAAVAAGRQPSAQAARADRTPTA